MQDEKEEMPLWIGSILIILAVGAWVWMDDNTDGTCTPKVTKERNCVNVLVGEVTQPVCFDMSKK